MSIIQTARSNQTVPNGNTTTSLLWSTAFPDNTYYVVFPSPEFQLTSSTQPVQTSVTGWSYLANGAGISITINNPNGGTINTQIDAIGILMGEEEDLDDLTTRVTALDGVGTLNPATAAVPVLKSSFNSVNNSNMQAVLGLEALVGQARHEVWQLKTQLQTVIAGASPAPTIIQSVTNGPNTMTAVSALWQITTNPGYAFLLPDATTLEIGQEYHFVNNSGSNQSIADSQGHAINATQATVTVYTVVLLGNATASGNWLGYVDGTAVNIISH